MKHGRKRVVCGVDFSPRSAEAGTVAALFARKMNGSVMLIHAQSAEDERAENPGQRRVQLEGEAVRLREAGPVVKDVLVLGKPSDVLVDFGEHNTTFIVVVGSGAASGTRRFVGTTAEQVAQRSPAPTLVIRDGAKLESWLRGQRTLNFVAAVDFSETSLGVLYWMREILRFGPCNLTLLHIDWPAVEEERTGEAPGFSAENSKTVQESIERDLKKWGATVLGDVPFGVRVVGRWGKISDHVNEVTEALQADLVAVGTHQKQFSRFWQGSISRGILRDSVSNVLVVPRQNVSSLLPRNIVQVRDVLVPTDFSDLANRAIPHAYANSRPGGRVHLLHVMTGPNGRKESECMKELQTLIPDEAEELGIQTFTEVVREKDVADAICHASARLGAQLICMASHGRTGFKRALLGSVAFEVLARSRRPVLILPPMME